MVFKITGILIVYSIFLFRQENINAPSHCRCEGNSPMRDEFLARRASYVENVYIWWRHHEYRTSDDVCNDYTSICCEMTVTTSWCGNHVCHSGYVCVAGSVNSLRPRQMDAISQTTFSNAFSWMKMFEFRLKFHWSLFPRVQLTIFQQWFR